MIKRPFRVRIVLVASTLLLTVAFATSIWATQYLAAHFRYHPALGSPWFGHIYAPWAWLAWQWQHYDTNRSLFNVVYIIFLLAIGLAFLLFALYYGFRSRTAQAHTDVHGTAHFASADEVEATGLLETNGGIYVGGYTDKDGQIHYLRDDSSSHALLIAPTRSGKGITVVVPTLLSWAHSVMVYDTKGELWNLTSGWRQAHAKNLVLKFDPAAETGSCAYNALAEIPLGTEGDVAVSQNISSMIVDPGGKGLEDHWAKTSHALLTGLILHTAYKFSAEGKVASLPDIAMTISDPARPLDELWDEMIENTHWNGVQHPVIASTGRDMLNTPEIERGSIVSTARSNLSLYRDPIVARNTSRSDFRMSDLMDNAQPVSLYLVVGPGDKDRLRPLIRLLVNQVIRSLVRTPIEFDADGRQKPVHKHRLLALMDEFPTLGRLDIFAESLAYIAGYGIKALLIAQDVPQLVAAYGKDESIISNCHVRSAFAPNKIETAKWLSDMLGTSTIVKEDVSTSGHRFGVVLEQVSTSLHEVQRPLLTPDECMRLQLPKKNAAGEVTEPGEMLIFVAGHAPIRGIQTPFFMDPVFSRRITIPPPKTDRISHGPSTSLKAFELR